MTTFQPRVNLDRGYSMMLLKMNRRRVIKLTVCYSFLTKAGQVFGKEIDSHIHLKCIDVSSLRNLNSLNNGQVILLTEYHKGSGKGGGLLKVDLNDKESLDDGGFCFINHSGQRLKRICPNNKILASCYGMVGNSDDDTDAFKRFIACKLDKIIDVNIFTKGMAQLADNTELVGSDKFIIYAMGDVNTDPNRSKNNQGQILEVGNNCYIDGVVINGGGYKNNGFLVEKRNNVTIKNSYVYNGRGQAILDYMSQGCVYDGNNLSSSYHGIQLWLSKNTIVKNNIISKVEGGIWSACAQNVMATGNTISNCSDVGLDWEGGNNCVSDGNVVKFCANGELAIFATGEKLKALNIPMGNLIHKNNKVERSGSYLSRNGIKKFNRLSDAGACMIYGNLDKHLIGPVVFESNSIVLDASDGKSVRCFSSRTSADSDAVIIIRNNKFESYSNDMGSLKGLGSVIFTGNEMVYHSKKYIDDSTSFNNVVNLNFTSNRLEVLNEKNDLNHIIIINSFSDEFNKVDIMSNTFNGFKSYAFLINTSYKKQKVSIKNNLFNPVISSKATKNESLLEQNNEYGKFFMVTHRSFSWG
jgi:parallel beta-helix repeat protein